MKRFIFTIAVLCSVFGVYAQTKYTFTPSEWVSTNSTLTFDYKTNANAITVTSATDYGINTNLSTSVSGNYYIESDEKYLVVKGSNLSTDRTKAQLWWLNGYNKGTYVNPTLVTTASDGDVVIIWDLTKSGFTSYMDFSGSDNITISKNKNSYITCFGLTSANGTAASVIKDINFYSLEEINKSSDYSASIAKSLILSDYNTLTSASLADPSTLSTDNYSYASQTAKDNYNNTTYSSSPSTDAEYVSSYLKYKYAKRLIESNALAEGVTYHKNMTYKISNARTLSSCNTWTRTSSFTYVYDGPFYNSNHVENTDLSSHWSYSAWTDNVSQTVNNLLPGKYLLSVVVRGNNTGTSTFTLTAIGKTTVTKSLPFNSTGQYFENGATYVVTEVEPDANNQINVAVDVNANANTWVSFGDFKLIRIAPAAFDEASALTPVADTTNVTLTRTLIANVWNSICLPFDVSASNLSSVLNATQVYALSTTNPEDNTVHLISATSIEAGKPYLFMPTAVSNDGTYTFTSAIIKADAAQTPANSLATFTGTYSPSSVPSGSYFVSDDSKLHRASAAVSMNGFRGYFTITTALGAKSYSLDFDNETTGIQSVTDKTETNGSTHADVFNIAGQLVSKDVKTLGSLNKGLYIINGKKYIVK